jgi:hypothetical protein
MASFDTDQNVRPVGDSPRAVLWIGLTIIAFFFGGFGAWAAFAPFATAVVAPAYVRVESYSKPFNISRVASFGTFWSRKASASMQDSG